MAELPPLKPKPGLNGPAPRFLSFLPTDLVIFKVKSDFFQAQTSYAQQTIEVASIISVVCYDEAGQWPKLLLPQTRVWDLYRPTLKISVEVGRLGRSSCRQEKGILDATLE